MSYYVVIASFPACSLHTALRFYLEQGHNVTECCFATPIFVLPFLCLFVCTIYVQYCDQRRNEFFPQTENRR